MINVIDGYGCWCYLSDTTKHGAGYPQNEIDGYCQSLQHAYRCSTIDDDLCDAKIQNYTAPLLERGDQAKDITKKCTELNPDNTCSRITCIIEADFVQHVIVSALKTDKASKHSEDLMHSTFEEAKYCQHHASLNRVRVLKEKNDNKNDNDIARMRLAPSDPDYIGDDIGDGVSDAILYLK